MCGAGRKGKVLKTNVKHNEKISGINEKFTNIRLGESSLPTTTINFILYKTVKNSLRK